MSGRTLFLFTESVLRSIITSGNPNQMNLPFALRKRRAMIGLIRTKFGIEMPIRLSLRYPSKEKGPATK
jgi:hypothetical protein